MALPPVFIEFLGSYKGLSAAVKGVKGELASVEAENSTTMQRLGKVSTAALAGLGIAAVGVAFKTTEMAASFQQAMIGISTQAGVPKSQLASLGNGVLDLAGKVGFSPDSLAEALYHIESSFASVGITGPKALDLLHVAADGAAVGHANLVDVTNALDAAVASGIPGVQNLSQAMGALNAIVGSGDMEMQDLADALGTGVLAVVKGYGLSLADVGAALATFGDNNIRGAVAATDLRMAVQALSSPVAGAKKYLTEFGMSANTLKTTMQNQGLGGALNLLQSKFKAAGITAKTEGGVITDMFGKKAGSGLAVLMGQIDRFNSKYPELKKGANGFTDAVAQQQATFTQKMKDMQAAIQALGVKIGTALLPFVTKFAGVLTTVFTYLTSHGSVLKTIGIAFGVLGASLAVASISMWAFNAAALANPVTWIVAGIVAASVAIALLITHFKQIAAWVRGNMPAVASVFVAIWHGALALFSAVWDGAMTAVHAIVQWFDSTVLKWIQARMADFSKWWSQNGAEISQVWALLWSDIKNIADIVWSWLKVGFTVMGAVLKTVWDAIVNVVKGAWNIISSAVTMGIHLVLNIISVVADIITGHWSKLWHDLLHLVTQTFADLWHFLGSVVSTIWNLLLGIGRDIIHGIIAGLTAAGSAIFNTLKDIAKNALNDIKSFLGINSPSRVFRDQVGVSIPEGIAAGIDKGAHHVHRAMHRLHHKIIHKGSGKAAATKMTNFGIYLALHLVKGLTGSQKQIQAATDHVLTVLMQMHTRAAASLERYVEREGSALERLAKKRDSIAAQLKNASKNLAAIEKQWVSERDSVAKGIMQGTSVVMSAPTNGTLTAGDVLANMYDQTEKAQQFANNLKRLQQMGLSSTMINQLAQAGFAQGGDTAAALASASQAQIKQLNVMQGNLQTSANSTGAAVANSMYGAGIDSAKGLIRGLQSQESAIERQMLKIANSMKNAIKRALGIHSPSRVFHEIGTFVTAGLKNGVDQSAADAVKSVATMGAAIVKAGNTAVSTPRLGSQQFASGTVIFQNTVNVRVEGTVKSDRDLRDMLQKEMLDLAARNSRSWQPFRR